MELLPIKKRSKRGDLVQLWQYFLKRKGLYTGPIDRDFGNGTETATINYQASVGLSSTGKVKDDTYSIALNDGLTGLLDDLAYPSEPDFPRMGRKELKQIFGSFDYVSAPTPKDNRTIKILDDWKKKNIIGATIPQLAGVTRRATMYVHKLLENQMIQMWAAWENAGLSNKVLSYEGSFVPRFIGGTTKLSYHSYGTTFDINYNWNKWGFLPAPFGDEGSVRELVPIAHEFGFYWGGHFKSKKDGMHFEVAKLLANSELERLSNKFGLD